MHVGCQNWIEGPQSLQSFHKKLGENLKAMGGEVTEMDVAMSVLNKLTSKYENLLVVLDAEGECEVDDSEWVRYFTRHGVPRPAKARLISPMPPQPQGLPRHPR